MSQYKLEGEFSNINERQLEFINEVILQQNLQVDKVIFGPLGKAGDNFMSDVKRISVEGAHGSLKMIVKVASDLEAVRSATGTELLFTNEHVMYTEVLPKLLSLQKAAGVPKKEHLRYAKCYGSLNEAPNEVIILEDLNESNFKMLNKFEPLSEECIRIILKNFGIFHSLSYALKHKEPATYHLFSSKLKDTWDVRVNDPNVGLQFELLLKMVLPLLDNDTQKNIVKDKLSNVVQAVLNLSEDKNSGISVIHQGDAWTNNFMFRFEEGDLRESVMVDYQASSSHNPMTDILFMIYICTDHEARSQNLHDWLDYYHSELDKSLSHFGLKANDIYSRDQLNADLKRYGKLLFATTVLFNNVLMRDASEVTAMMEALKIGGFDGVMENMDKHAMSKETFDRSKKRLLDLIETYTQYDLL
ncbi:uncharacterized protein LOC111354374 [Spodoptera litura]|uniref:Uncharacterized protein LOC111354374 n=1 Tax=Spodoptera litura TaxID=69820 RepID=A0A9J7E7F5_SPOLT|nr:uncharacterized protein LOC111354374 [Spodoptera litura]